MARKMYMCYLLDQEDVELLREESQRTGQSMSALVRQAIRKVYGGGNGKKR